MNDNPDPQPSGMIHDLIAARKRAIAVVDNCAPDLHRRLTEIARAPESTVSFITVEYDIQEDEPEGTEVFRLEPSSPKLVEELLKRRFPEMSRVDASTIAEFSGGNARVALALANTLDRHETLAGLKDEELFKRLFYQRQARDSSLLNAAQACALVYSFQGEALSGGDAELPVFATLAGMSTQELYAKVAELKQRDLLQRRGVWRAVLPHAIANQLAVMALKAIPFELIEAQLTTNNFSARFRVGSAICTKARRPCAWLRSGLVRAVFWRTSLRSMSLALRCSTISRRSRRPRRSPPLSAPCSDLMGQRYGSNAGGATARVPCYAPSPTRLVSSNEP